MRTFLSLRLLLVVSLFLGLTVTADTASAQELFSVNSKGDAPDANVGDDICDTGNMIDGVAECTLRAAIEESNGDPDTDNILFDEFDSGDLTGGVIEVRPDSSLPDITETVSIFGSSAPGTALGQPPTVVVDESNSGAGDQEGVFHLRANSDGSTIENLSIVSGSTFGITVFVDDASISGSYIGLKPDGVTTAGNDNSGIYTNGSGTDIRSNVITGNDVGIVLFGNDNVVDDNLIGVTADSSSAPGNGSTGIGIYDSNNVIGQGPAGQGNVISGHGSEGILLESGRSNEVRTNRIGTTPDGTGEFPNAGAGIRILSDSNVIGNVAKTTTTEQNLISGNDGNGIVIGNSGTSADSTRIAHNIIGLTADSSSTLPNGGGASTGGGIVCTQSASAGSDHTTVVEKNIIAGNDGQGLWITDSCYDWHVLDNFVGTTPAFQTGLGNQFNGMNVKSNPSGNAEEFDIVENIVGGNSRDGIDLRGGYHDVSNNYVGVAPDGSDIGNGSEGVIVHKGSGLPDVLVGDQPTPHPGDGNAAGHATPAGDGNVIGYNGSDGILIRDGASSHSVSQNYIGTGPADANFGNAGDGVRIVGNGSASTGHNVGYDESFSFTDPDPANGGFGNVIAYNDGDGISLGASASATDVSSVSVRGNITYQNGGTTPQLGIDLGNNGTSTNDAGDGDSGPNTLQNFPNILNVSRDASTNTVTIDYEVKTNDTGSNYPLTIDFYAADSEASGEGQTYLTTQDYSTANSTASLSIDLDNYSGVSHTDHFVTTVTDANGNTSEFVATASPLPVEITSFDATQSGESSVKLSWSTASETNNAGFRVQHRGPTRETWSKVGFVESRAQGGTTSEATKYRFETSDLAIGSHQFRLEQVDLSGETHLEEAVTVDLTMQEPVMLSAPAPNPVQRQATFSFAVREAQSTSVTVYNVLGQKVRTLYRGTPNAGEETDVTLQSSDLADGVYFVRIRAGRHTRMQRMTVVN